MSLAESSGNPMMLLFRRIWFILKLDCEGSAELTSESFDRTLHWSERWAVRLHCLICRKSFRLNRQMTALDERLRRTGEESMFDLKLPDEAREKIRQKLNGKR